MRSFDWSASDLGPPGRWPENLRTAVSLCLTSRFPILIWWGPDLNVLYNDAYIPFLGGPSTRAASGGRGGRSGPRSGTPSGRCSRASAAPGRRPGRTTSCPSSSGTSRARRSTSASRTARSSRPTAARSRASSAPAPRSPTRSSGPGGWRRSASSASSRRSRAPSGRRAPRRRGCSRGTRTTSRSRPSTSPTRRATARAWSRRPACPRITRSRPRRRRPRAMPPPGRSPPCSAAGGRRRSGTCAARRAPPRLALAGATGPRGGPAGPRPESRRPGRPARPRRQPAPRAGTPTIGPSSTSWPVISARAVADARAYEAERRRAEALAELDRAKTAFFSNVSHEFRTPLTLMLGPVEDALADADEPLPPGQRERLETAHRSGLRLLKLVNTLLDFSRIEAGRARASYEPTDLAALTAELASNFRSACEKAGLRLVVDCPPLPEPVFVDRDMWEKVVLNLVSNAFKFTLEGEIVVRLGPVGGAAELAVRDTGTGIPAEELPRIFERFHRVEGARGRTHEGTGHRPGPRPGAGPAPRRLGAGGEHPRTGQHVRRVGPPGQRPTCPPIRSGRPARRRPPRWGRPPSSRRHSAGCPMRRPPRVPSTAGDAREASPPATRPRSRRARAPPPREGARAVLGSSGPTTTRTCATTSAGSWNRGTTWRPCRTARRPWPRPGRARRTWCSPT